jgi:glutamate:GABA antiporter
VAGPQIAQERNKLKKVLRRWDMIFFTVCALLGLDAVAPMAQFGLGQGLIWLFVLVFLFLLPYGLVTAELGSAFPAEGGIYSWVRLAYGTLPGGLTSMFYWFSNAIWIGGTLAGVTIAAINGFFMPANKPVGLWASIIIGLLFVWVNVLLTVIALKHGKWVGNIGAWLKTLAVVLFVVLGIAYLIKHGVPSGIAPAHSYVPSVTGFLAVAGTVVFLYVGFELQSGAGEEMTNPKRDVPLSIFRSGLVQVVCYAAVVLGMLLVLPVKQLTGVSGFTGSFATINTELFGSGGPGKAMGYLFATMIILILVATGTVWVLGSCRVEAMAALDGAAPRWMGKFSKQGTPISMAIITGIVGSVFVIIVLGIYKGSVSSFFSVMLSLTLSTAILAYLFSIPAVITLRRKFPNLPRPFAIPGGKVGLWVSVVLSEFFMILTVVTMLWPGLINNMLGQSYSMQDSWGVGRGYFEIVTFGSVVVVILVTIGLWIWGRAETKGASEEGEELLEGVVTQQ